MYGLSDKDIKNLQNVFSTFDQISKVILFGSRAKGDFKKGSDIDFAVIGQEIDLSLLHDIELCIDELNLPYHIDLLNYNNLSNDALRRHIEKNGKIFFQSDTSSYTPPKTSALSNP